ncbi:MAG: SulP family inorganic anion transporter [Actinomycetia bacterium]|nr:SulP family inorganic anion transporter [Actinomycetes bacterium]
MDRIRAFYNKKIKSARSLFSKETLKDDTVAGVVLGVESVPDGLAGGLLAGVNPIFGLYGYMVGTFTGGLFTSSSFMAVQATGAMAIVVADVGLSSFGEDQDRALFTLAVLTGVIMFAAGAFKLGFILRFVSNAVMVGFINAVGVNIILGQLDNFTGYESQGSNRVLRAIDTLFNLNNAHGQTLLIGTATIVLIVLLERTKLDSLGMVVAIILTSAVVVITGWEVAQLLDIADVPRSLPGPVIPLWSAIPALMIPALSLAFIGLVQGAGISANFPNPDGNYPDASQDFIGQGAANIAAGVFQGMPVGGSMSASSLVKSAGAKSRLALLIAAGVMAMVILIFADAVGYIAMPALAGLLMIVGFRTIKPADIKAVWKTGMMQATVMTVTFILTMVIPLQYAVLVGVGISMILFVVTQSNQVTLKRWVYDGDGNYRETEPPAVVPSGEVTVLQPYGSLFFAAAPVFEEALPNVEESSTDAVVILRLRGRTDLGSTFMDVLLRYADELTAVGSKLVLVSADESIDHQLAASGVRDAVGDDNIYEADMWVGATLKRAQADAVDWIDEHPADTEPRTEND